MIVSAVWKVEIRTGMKLSARNVGIRRFEILVAASSPNEALYKVREALIEDVNDPENAVAQIGGEKRLPSYEITSVKKQKARIVAEWAEWDSE